MRQITAATLLGLLLMVGRHAAAQPAAMIISLKCDGTIQHPWTGAREPFAVGLVINLAERTVLGFGIVAHIRRIDASSISFNGQGPSIEGGMLLGTITVSGELDRITGALSGEMGFIYEPGTKYEKKTENSYEVICKATNRLF
jgi:hypothetical protein